MAQKQYDFNTVSEWHRKGLWDAAKEGYLHFIRMDPNHVEALHALGILYLQQEQYDKAIELLQKAHQLNRNDPTIALHLANVFKIQGQDSQAIHLLEETLHTHPNYAPILNNLGNLYYAKENFKKAIDYFKAAIAKKPEYADAYYNLGLAYAKDGDIFLAIEAYKTLLQHVPGHFAARYLLAVTWLQQNNFEQAIEQFLKIETEHPFHFETQSNLATTYLKTGNLSAAKKHYLKALDLRHQDTQILFNLGVIHMQQGDIDHAIQFYQRAARLDPGLFDIHNNLGVAFLAKRHPGLALEHFKEALRIQPNNPSIAYTVKALSEDQHLLAAPPDYIQSLFDAYADHYDQHLLNALDYKIPWLFETMLRPWMTQKAPLDILDLGCGTGLVGGLLRPYAKTLTGVDLSPNMLDMARQKNQYDELIMSDLCHFLKNKTADYDLITAGDVFMYAGDLEEIFKCVYGALRPEGSFIFNTEMGTVFPFRMGPSGRFSHHQDYLKKLIGLHRFKVMSYQTAMTRMQNIDPVQGHIYLLRRGP